MQCYVFGPSVAAQHSAFARCVTSSQWDAVARHQRHARLVEFVGISLANTRDVTSTKDSQMNSSSSSKATKSNHTTDGIAQRVDALVAAGRDAAGEIKDNAIAAKDAVMDTGGSLVQALSKSIKNRPLSSVMIAFGAGYVVTRIMRMRSPSRSAN